jgi:hypothetical protein
MSTNSQRAVGQRRERPLPQYIARAKVGNGWVSIGAAWPLRSGEEGFSIKLTTTPLNWDGRFVLLPPLGDEEVTEEPAQEPEPEPRRRKRAEPAEAGGSLV